MKVKFTTTILIVFAFVMMGLSTTQGQTWAWEQDAGGIFADGSNSVATDPSGNVFITGWFNSPSIAFGSNNVSRHGYQDMFLAKYDANGNSLWAVGSSGSGASSALDVAVAVATDGSGNVFVTGYFFSTTFTLGTITLTNADSSGNTTDIFVAKYNASGVVQWAKSLGGKTTDSPGSVATDAAGNVYLTGFYIDSTITIGSTTLTNGGVGVYNSFLTKYDANGTVLWVKGAGGASDVQTNSVHIDGSGNVYITGEYYDDSLCIGTDTLANAGLYDFFLAKYNSAGDFIWAKSAGGASDESGSSVTTDAAGNVYVSGYLLSPSVTFGSITVTTTGYNVFLAKYDSSGNAKWVKYSNGNHRMNANSVSVNSLGNVFIAGSYNSTTLVFGSTTLTNADNSGTTADVFLVKYDTSGNVVYAKTIETRASGTYLGAVANDPTGDVYLTGYYDGIHLAFGSDTITGAGVEDGFLAKIDFNSGIEELTQINNGILVYPNPAHSLLNFHQSIPSPNQQLIITDLLGNEVYKEMLTGIDNTVSISTWSAGLYFYEVRGNTDIARGKFIKE